MDGYGILDKMSQKVKGQGHDQTKYGQKDRWP